MSTTQRQSTPKLTTSNLRTNDAGPSTPESRHRKRGSIATPIDSIANSPTGRKWSSSSTPQDAAVAPEEKVNKETMISQMVVGGVIASIVLTGIMYSLIHSTSLNTSLPHSHLPERANYLARKSNILNQWFVKKAWFWTSLGYLSHLASAPPSRSSRWTRLSVFALATACWLLFTTWFFGAALGDRIIALSGGDCAVMLPKEWGLTRPAIQHLLPSDTSASIMKAGEDLILPLPQSFCSSRLPLTAKTFPDLFALLPESLAEQRTKAPLPRFYKGFDISGHTFLLTLSTLVLCRELAPSWSKLVRTGRVGSSVGRGGQVHAVATLFGSALVGLWLVMLGATAVYFHNPPEKLSGLALGLLTATIVNFLTPEVAPSAVDATLLSTRETLQAGKRALDENAARRGQVIDDGAIIEDEDALSSKPKQD